MNETVKKDLPILEHRGQKILTTQQLAEIYETDINNIKNNFNNHKANFVEGKHYYTLKGKELREFKRQVNDIDLPVEINKYASSLYLWTERGANRHCKILDTDKAWEQFENLEETYFRVKETDTYMTTDILQKALLSPDFLIRLATNLKNEQEKNAKLLTENKKKDKRIEEMRPKEIFADSVSTSTSSILIGELAKILKQNGIDTGAKRLFAWLRENEYLIKRKGSEYNLPTQKSMEMKLFEIKETVITHSDGHISINKTPKVTGKGQVYFVNLFNKIKSKTATATVI